MPERKGDSSSEVRTAEFFQQNVSRLTDALIEGDGMVIAVPDSERRLRLVEVEPFNKSRVGARYREMNDMEPGDLWNPPMRRISQSLIVALDRQAVGACVRLLRANYFDPRSDSFVPTLSVGREEFAQREGDIAKFLGLGKYDRSRLEFVDRSNTLYLITGSREMVDRVRPQDANRNLERLVNRR